MHTKLKVQRESIGWTTMGVLKSQKKRQRNRKVLHLLPLSMLWARARVLQISIPRNLFETRSNGYYVPDPVYAHSNWTKAIHNLKDDLTKDIHLWKDAQCKLLTLINWNFGESNWPLCKLNSCLSRFQILGLQVPHITDNSPGCHKLQQMRCEGLPANETCNPGIIPLVWSYHQVHANTS